MSRYYDCYIEPTGKLTPQEQDIIDAYIGDTWLTGGESEEEYAERISKEIWCKLKKFVHLDIRLTYMEDLPYEEYEYGNDEYNRMKEDGELEGCSK